MILDCDEKFEDHTLVIHRARRRRKREKQVDGVAAPCYRDIIEFVAIRMRI